jgi:hypothetical protein
MNDKEIKIEDVLADMRNQIAMQAQEIAILRATITQYRRTEDDAGAKESTQAD